MPWNAFNGFVQLRFALEICSSCKIMHMSTKLQEFLNFWPQKMLQHFIAPSTLHIYLRQTIFCSPKLKMKLKGFHVADVTEIQEAVTDELKKVQK